MASLSVYLSGTLPNLGLRISAFFWKVGAGEEGEGKAV